MSTLFDTGPEMTIGALSPWAGSKRNLSSDIVRELGRHQKYDEPFCGSCSILLAKEAATRETVNDLHGDLINLARVLKDENSAVALYANLSRLLMHEELFHESAKRWRDAGHKSAGEIPSVERAADFMVCSWFGRNGMAGTSNYNQGFCVRYTKNGGHAGKRWCSAVESIPAWHERLRHVTILNRDGFELLERLEDAPGCAIYCDPPYLQKGFKYVHDFESDDHRRLAELLCRFKQTRVVVSYYADDRLATLYRGWTFRKLKAIKALVSQGMRDKKGATEAPEVLIINGESYA